ncbi:MAG: DUF533 domain-containing protein [Pirellula sp.]
MNAIDILGSLLGAGQSGAKGGGGAADILAEILGGQAAPASRGGQRSPNAHTSAEQLEEMLGVGRESASASPRGTQQAPSSSIPTDIFGQRKIQEPKINLSVPKPAPISQNDQAVLFIRAMINSAKVDGEISDEEQKNILGQIGDTSPETVKFLRAEFARPLNVVEYAQSLPVGMELNAYSLSLTAIKLDTKEEADYLRQLAKALRITPDQCNQIHQQQNAPLMYQA